MAARELYPSIGNDVSGVRHVFVKLLSFHKVLMYKKLSASGIDQNGFQTVLGASHFVGTLATGGRTELLVSVRNAAEAQNALAGGADVIDIKEPLKGPLGRAAPTTIHAIHEVVRGVAGDAHPVTAALGELPDLPEIAELTSISTCINAAKVGLSGCRAIDWQTQWRRLGDQLAETSHRPLIAVVYADWQSCGAPAPEEVIATALQSTSPGVLFDTFSKNGRTLLDWLPLDQLRNFVAQLRESQRFVALAGSLQAANLNLLTELDPEIIAVRSAVCRGGRRGTVDADLVAGFRREMREKLASSATPQPATTRPFTVRKGR